MNIWNKVELIKERNLLPQGWIALVLIGFGIYYLAVYLYKIKKNKQNVQCDENVFKFIVLLVLSHLFVQEFMDKEDVKEKQKV